MDPAKLTLNFQHPTDSGKVLTAAVSRTATPSYLLAEMTAAGFVPQPDRVGQYKLRDLRTNVQLLDTMSLEAAGVANNSTLLVDHTTTGA